MKINEEDNDETMDTSSNQEKDKYEGMTLDSKPSTPELPNTGQVFDSNDDIETTKQFYKTNTNTRLTTIIPTST